MTGFALGLVLTSAFLHAGWNFLAKRTSGGAALVWLFAACSVVFYAPIMLAVLLWQQPVLGWREIGVMVGSGGIHLGYFLLLQRGYQVGDLSVVYPLARGTGPMLSTTLAIALLGERPTPVAIAGIGLIAVGVFLLTFKTDSSNHHRWLSSVIYALLTGVFIAAYTLWDKFAVSQLQIPPLVYDWSANFSRTLLLTPIAFSQWPTVQYHWQTHRREVLGIACLSPLSYILVLTALVFSPVSYIAPAREISIVIGAAMGTQLLAEGNAVQRLVAAGLMMVGVVALAIG